MESGAKGCEVVVSGKLRAARAKSMKFVDGFMIHAGEPTNHYIVQAVRHVLLRQGRIHHYWLQWKRVILTFVIKRCPRIESQNHVGLWSWRQDRTKQTITWSSKAHFICLFENMYSLSSFLGYCFGAKRTRDPVHCTSHRKPCCRAASSRSIDTK